MAGLCACGGSEDTLPDDLVGCAGYEEPGPYAVGMRTLELDGEPVEVWYPAEPAAAEGLERESYDMREWLPSDAAAKIPDEDTPIFEMAAYRDIAAAQDRKFPIVLFSHGMGGYRMQSSFLMTHLASWGFVVAAPEHPERGLALLLETGAPAGDNGPDALRGTLALLESENQRSDGFLEGRLNLSKVAVTGHSMGGAAVLTVAVEPEFKAWMTFATGGGGYVSGEGPAKPSFMMAGLNDEIAEAAYIERGYERQAPDKRYLAINGMGHLGFTDICAVGRDRGGVLQIAIDHGVDVPDFFLDLGRDGCGEEDLPPEDGWPIVSHYTTAQLKHALGINSVPAGLGDETTSCFDDLVATYLHD
jgi:dienelactone hydrolase